MNKTEYTVQELSELFGVSERTILRKIKTISDKLGQVGKRSKIDASFALYLKEINGYEDKTGQIENTNDNEYDHIQYYTDEEYHLLHKKLVEHPMLQKQVEDLKEQIIYHKKQYETLMQTLQNITRSNELALNSLIQRGLIEVKEKGLDKI